MIKSVLVLGAGSAGLLAALSLKRKIPQLNVRVVRSPDLGVIGVGESTTPTLPKHLFEYLGLNRRQFHASANPTWKMGIHFIWGPRPSFEYAFEPQLDAQWTDLPMPNGYFCEEEFDCVNTCGALMSHGKAFRRNPGTGGPEIPHWEAFHIFNPTFVATLETFSRAMGIEIIDGKFSAAERGPQGITAILLDDGRRLDADFFVDASGFRGELLGKTLQEPWVTFSSSLFCDRAVVGSWMRTDEPILPYTIAETMDAGWCWQIEHEDQVNRGYVFSSQFLSDDAAHAEFMRKNPKAKTWDHTVKFRSGRFRRLWVDNVVAVGNAAGFVEPLEATALMVLCGACQTLVGFLQHSQLAPTPTLRDLYNKVGEATWEEIRDFLAIHYRYNTRLDTPFWKHCRAEADVAGAAPLLKFYEENGPTGLCRHELRNISGAGNQFGVEGFLALLIGQRVPHRNRYAPTEREWQLWRQHTSQFRSLAQQGVDVKEALAYIRHPNWRWRGE